MSDEVDIANSFSEKMLDTVIGQRPKFEGVSLYECQECGDDIPEQRRKLGNVKFCIGCQTYIESKRIRT